jgi:hypothetical protein
VFLSYSPKETLKFAAPESEYGHYRSLVEIQFTPKHTIYLASEHRVNVWPVAGFGCIIETHFATLRYSDAVACEFQSG